LDLRSGSFSLSHASILGDTRFFELLVTERVQATAKLTLCWPGRAAFTGFAVKRQFIMQVATLVPALSHITKLDRSTAKQLCFDFADESPSRPAARGKAQVPAKKRIRTLKRIPRAGEREVTRTETAGTASIMPAEQSINLESVRSGQRYGAPIRMGAAMIAVLKRYGITDQEIQEGVEAYASKFQTAAAS
jgi:hypothetical protein